MKERVSYGTTDKRGVKDLPWPRRWLAAIRSDLTSLRESRFVLYNFVSTKLKVRYQRSTLGFIWTLLHPAMMLTVLAVVFTHVLGRTINRFPVYLCTGIVPFQFFSSSIVSGSCSIIKGEAILKKIYLYRMVLPLSAVLVAAVNMVFAQVALFLVLQFFGARLTVHAVLLPAAILAMAVFTFGVVLIAMTLVTYYRDFEHIISVVLRLLYFASPVLLTPRHLGKYKIVMTVNPLSYLLKLFRCALYENTWPDGRTWLIAGGSAVAALLVGYIMYKTYEHDYIYRL